jgi:hypothetical protein
MATEISLGYLAMRPTTTRFLAKNLRVASQLGRDETDEMRFVAATERMTNAGLVFGPGQEAESIRSAFQKLSGVNRFGDIFNGRSKTSSNQRLDIGTSSFLGTHTELLSLFKESPELRDALEEDIGQAGFDVVHAVATAARSRLGPSSSITVDDLEQRPQQALLVALNIGGAADLLKENPNLARAFVRDPAEAWQDVVAARVAEKAASLFQQGSPITEKFLQSHQRTAIFLLENAGRVRSLNADVKEAREFVHTANDFETRLEDYVTDRATDLLESHLALEDETIESNPDFAALLVGDFLTRDNGTIIGFLNNNVSTIPEDVSFRKLLGGQFARAALSRLPNDSPFDLAYLESNPGIAGLIIASDAFVTGLSKDRDLLERFVQVPGLRSTPLDTDLHRAMAAFSTGYITRPGQALDLRG